MVEDWLEQILARGDIWGAPLEDIAAHVSQMRASGGRSHVIEPARPYPAPVFKGFQK